MKHIEIEFTGGKSKSIGFVKDSDYDKLDKAFGNKEDRFIIDLFPLNEGKNPTRHHINLNTVMEIKELPN